MENRWMFQTSPLGTRENEIIAEEFFASSDALSEATSLVRESIQNSLDEVCDSTKPVKMVFTIGVQTPENTKKYFDELDPHLKATPGLRELPNDTDPRKFLVVEDFNTLGLDGPIGAIAPTSNQIEEGLFRFSFWHFEWKAGGSNKRGSNRGSWGVGKIVFPRASRIKSYLVLSKRKKYPENDPDVELGVDSSVIMFGHSILKYREHDEFRYVPDCQWMVEGEQYPFPSLDRASQKEFVKDWSLSRKLDTEEVEDQFGTSIVIPFCRADMSASNLVQSIICDYFMPILSGNLECVVNESGSTIFIDKNSILHILLTNADDDTLKKITKRSRDELIAIIELYKSYIEESSNPDLVIGGTKDKWSDVCLEDGERTRIRDKYNDSNVIRLSVKAHIPSKSDVVEGEDTFTVLLKKYQNQNTHINTVFCREDILIPAANNSSNLRGCVSIVIVKRTDCSNSLADLLRSAEGPSHDRWSNDSTHIKGLYKSQSQVNNVIRWVKNSAMECLKLINFVHEADDDKTLSEYFPICTDDPGPKPDPNKAVTLYGQRDQQSPDQVKLRWSIKGDFTPISCVLKCLKPEPSQIIYTGEGDQLSTDYTYTTTNSNSTYEFQIDVSNGTKTISSNIVKIKPIRQQLNPLHIDIIRTPSGFRIEGRPGVVVGRKIRVHVAYLSRGSKSKWTAGDFVLSDLLQETIKGLTIFNSEDNYHDFEITDTTLEAEWKGFDMYRDLLIDLKEIK